MTETASPDASRSILLVEDEMLLSMLLEDMLVDLGHRVAGSASRVDEALSMLERTEFDLAILDVNVAGKTIVPVADVLALRGIPFVFSTGDGLPPEPFTDRPILRKPFVLNDLERVLKQVIGS